MAASGKKNKKNKWKPVDVTTVLAETRPVTAWADEVEIDERDLQIAAARKSALPTAPRSARGTDDERVPNAPPYVAYITNIPFELVEEDLVEFFGELQIENIRLPINDSSGRLKGYGYVEFTERQGLIEALQISDKSLKGRRIRIDVSENSDRDRGYGRSDRMGRDRMGMGIGRGDDDPDRALGDWRSAPRVEPAGEDRMRSGGRSGYGGGGFGDRERDGGGFGAPRESDNREGGWREGMGSGTSGGSGGFGDRGGDRDSYRNRGFGDRDKEGFDRGGGGGSGSASGSWFSDRGGDRDGDRPRYGGDRDGDRPRYGGDRDGDRPRYGGDRDGDRPRYGGDRDGDRPRYGGDRDGDRPRYGGDRERDDDKYPRRDDVPPSESSEPKARPKLNLAPRTKPIENPLPPPEEVKEKEKPAEPAAPPVPRASIFGAAKPVDTAARERQIEERLARERDRPPRRDDRDKSPENTSRSKENSEHGDESHSKKVEPAPPPKENAWSRRPRIEPSANNGDGTGNTENDRRETSPESNDGSRGRPLSGEHKKDENTGRSGSYGNNRDGAEGGGSDSREGGENRYNRSGSKDKEDNRDEDHGQDESSKSERYERRGARGSGRGGTQGPTRGHARVDRGGVGNKGKQPPDRPSRKDHSSEDQPRLPKYEEKPLPNFVASNKFAFLNEDDDPEDA